VARSLNKVAIRVEGRENPAFNKSSVNTERSPIVGDAAVAGRFAAGELAFEVEFLGDFRIFVLHVVVPPSVNAESSHLWWMAQESIDPASVSGLR